MLKLCRDTIIFTMMLLSHTALSNSLLTQHALATSQAISAFYMYSLTEGDDRYQREYSIAIEKAHLQFLALKKDDWQLALELEPLWDRILAATMCPVIFVLNCVNTSISCITCTLKLSTETSTLTSNWRS